MMRSVSGRPTLGEQALGLGARGLLALHGAQGAGHHVERVERLDELLADALGRVEAVERLLEDHADAARAELAHLVGAERREVDLVEQDAPARAHRGDELEQPDHRHRGHGLAAAGLAHDAQRLARGDAQADLVHELGLDIVGEDGEREVGELEHPADPFGWCGMSGYPGVRCATALCAR